MSQESHIGCLWRMWVSVAIRMRERIALRSVRKWIAREQCQVGHFYAGVGLGFNVAVWDGTHMIGVRERFGSRFLAPESHWDSGGPCGTYKPLKDLGEVPGTVEVKGAIKAYSSQEYEDLLDALEAVQLD